MLAPLRYFLIVTFSSAWMLTHICNACWLQFTAVLVAFIWPTRFHTMLLRPICIYIYICLLLYMQGCKLLYIYIYRPYIQMSNPATIYVNYIYIYVYVYIYSVSICLFSSLFTATYMKMRILLHITSLLILPLMPLE